jgi:hypothetical protein
MRALALSFVELDDVGLVAIDAIAADEDHFVRA